MTEISYIFGDVLTGQIIAEMPLKGVSMTRMIGGGDFRAAFNLDQTGQDNETVVSATEPGRCYVVCERDGTPIWGGIIRSRTYQSQGKAFQIYCRDVAHYPEYRIVRTDFLNEDIEQRNIFRSLWSDMMSDPSSVQVVLPSSYPTVVTKSLDVKAFEMKSYRSAMDMIANGDDGFDWSIDTVRVENSYQWHLRTGYPRLGTTNPDTAVVFDYPGSVLNYWENENMSDHGTHFFGVGSGEGSSMLIQPVIHSDLIAGNYPRYDVALSLKSVQDADTLTSLTTQMAVNLKGGTKTLTLELKADKTPEFGSYGLGDMAKIYIDDPAHTNPVDRPITTRIIGWEYYPPSSDHTELARIVFEGDGS